MTTNRCSLVIFKSTVIQISIASAGTNSSTMKIWSFVLSTAEVWKLPVQCKCQWSLEKSFDHCWKWKINNWAILPLTIVNMTWEGHDAVRRHYPSSVLDTGWKGSMTSSSDFRTIAFCETKFAGWAAHASKLKTPSSIDLLRLLSSRKTWQNDTSYADNID